MSGPVTTLSVGWPRWNRRVSRSLGLLLLLFSHSAFGEDSEIHIEVAVGFSSTIPVAPPGRCTPLRVILTNEGDPFQGELFVQQKGSPQSCSVPVDLPSESRLAYHLTFFPKPDPDYSKDDDLLEARLLDHRGHDVQTEVTPLQFPRERDRVLAVFGTPGRPYGMLGFRPPEEDEDTPARLIIPGEADLLPEDVLEYEGIWAVVWDGQDWGSVSQTQCDVLLQFVDMGGTLVIGSGSRWQDIMRTPVAPYLPVAYEGASQIGSTSGWEKLGVTDPTISAAVVGAFGPLVKEAEVLVKAEGRPLIVRCRYGGGRIIQFGIPFSSVWWSGWDDWQRFSRMIFREGGLPDRRCASELLQAVLFHQQATFQVRLPSRWQVAAVLLAHIILAVAGGYFLFRRRDLLLAWVLFAVLAGLFGGSIYAIGNHLFAKQAGLRTVTWLQARAGSRYALADTGMVLYSPRTYTYSLRFPETGAFPVVSGGLRPAEIYPFQWGTGVPRGRSRRRWPRFWERRTIPQFPAYSQFSPFPLPSRGGEMHVRFGEGPVIKDFRVQQWSTRAVHVTHVVDLQGTIDGGFLVEGDEFRLSIENNSILNPGRTYVMNTWGHREVADLRTGGLVSSSNQAMRPARILNRLGWRWDPWWYTSFVIQRGQLQRSEWPWSRDPGRALLVSRLEMRVVPCEISPDVKSGESVSLAAVELPVSLTGEAIGLSPLNWKWSVEEGDAYSVRGEVVQRNAWQDPPLLGTLDIVRLATSEATFRFQPGIDLRGWEIEYLRLSFPELQDGRPSPGVQPFPPGAQWPPSPFLIDPVKQLSLRAFDFQGNVWVPLYFSNDGASIFSGRFAHPLYREVLLEISAKNSEAQARPFSLNLEAHIRRKEAT